MKKLTVIIALMLVVTIGGVYATWDYAQGAVANAEKALDGQTTITAKVITTSKGTITIDPSNLSIVIDDANHDHIGELTTSGSILVTFTPNTLADPAVRNQGIKMQFKVAVNNLTYNGTPVFTVVTDPVPINGGVSTMSATIPVEDLGIQLSHLELHTPEEYDDFYQVLHQGNISITVSEVQ